MSPISHREAAIEPDVDLARSAGLEVSRGIVVDDHMRTADPNVLAAGDAAEVSGRVIGLWPASLDQGRVAAINATGGDERYSPTLPPAKLKVAAIDLLSVGEIKGLPDGLEIAFADRDGSRYRNLFLDAESRVVGAILIGYPELADALIDAVAARQPVEQALVQLRRGDWSSVGALEMSATR